MKSFDLIRECQRLIAIDSVTRTGSIHIANHLISLVKEFGLDLHTQLQSTTFEGVDQVNIIFHKGTKDGDAFVWNCHLDTVDPGDTSLWTEGGPLSGVIKDDRIYGLGSADTKLGIICMLKALSFYIGKPFKVPFYLVGTCCEEVGLFGVRELMKSPPFKPKFVINTEPSELQIVYAHKGLFAVEITLESEKTAQVEGNLYRIQFFGKSAHSSSPHLGKNAIVMGLNYLLHHPELDVATVQGGTVMNKIPESCVMDVVAPKEPLPPEDGKVTYIGKGSTSVHPKEVLESLLALFKEYLKVSKELENEEPDVRFTPARPTTDLPILRDEGTRINLNWGFRRLPRTSADFTESKISSSCESVRTRHPSIGTSYKIVRNSHPFETAASSPLIKTSQKALHKLGLSDTLVTKAASSEASVYSAHGADVIVIGPGRSEGNVHSPNEFNTLSQLELAVKYYRSMIEGFLV